MWDDPRQLNAVATLIAFAACALLAWAAITWVVRQPVFAFREIVVATPLARANGAHLESVIRGELSGTFFTLDLEGARAALSRVPWVRDVALRREWPRRLTIEVDEHAPLARWNESALVNTHGETFVADYDGELPQFNGPDGQAAIVAQRFAEWSAMLSPLGLALRVIALSARGGWEIRATGESGPLTIALPRDDPAARLARFVTAYPRTLAVLARSGTRVERVDLRYRNGFAVRVPVTREPRPRPK
jgi:cell division protein FtsQ